MATKVFQFGKKRTKKIPLKNRPAEELEIKTSNDDVPQPIQGIEPGSKEEYWVALALQRLDLGFIYQFDISGGRSFRGGQVVDFLVYTVPLPTPVFVQGEYWHGGTKSAESHFKVVQADRYFAGEAQPAIEIWDYEIPDKETTYQVVKEKLR